MSPTRCESRERYAHAPHTSQVESRDANLSSVRAIEALMSPPTTTHEAARCLCAPLRARHARRMMQRAFYKMKMFAVRSAVRQMSRYYERERARCASLMAMVCHGACFTPKLCVMRRHRGVITQSPAGVIPRRASLLARRLSAERGHEYFTPLLFWPRRAVSYCPCRRLAPCHVWRRSDYFATRKHARHSMSRRARLAAAHAMRRRPKFIRPEFACPRLGWGGGNWFAGSVIGKPHHMV